MKTIDDLRWSLNFRNLAGGSRSFDDLRALRELLVGEANRLGRVLGQAGMCAALQEKYELQDELSHHAGWVIGLIEADIMAIDAFLEARGK